MKTTAKRILMSLGFGVLFLAMTAPAHAGTRVSFAYTNGPADVRVWLDHIDTVYDQGDYDVYPSVDEVVLYVRASRSTYAAVYVVDTEGFIHVVHPCGPGESSFLRGGRVYGFRLSELGFHGYHFDRGVAYAYAVTSPVPFTYASYDIAVFGPRWGFRIQGDPYVAARHFYLSLVPTWCDRGLVGISYARFYVREYVRYPAYLCTGWHENHGVRTYCRGDCSVFRSFRTHAGDPYRVLRPQYRLARDVDAQTVIRTVKYADPPQRDARPRVEKIVRNGDREARKIVAAKQRPVEGRERLVGQEPQGTISPAVRSSRDDYVRGKRNIAAMRSRLREQAANEKSAVAVAKVVVKSAPERQAKATASKDSKRARSASKNSKQKGAK